MLISEIITEIITEVGGDTDDTELAALLLTCFKAGRRRVPAFINDRSFLGRGTFTLAQGNYSALLSGLTGFVRERAFWWQQTDLSRVPIIPPPSLGYFHTIIRPQTPGKPLYYNIYAGTIEFDKNADTALTIGADYFKEVSTIVVGDTFVGDESMVEISKDFGKAVYFRNHEEDITRANDYENSAGKMMREKEGDWEEQNQGARIEMTQGD